MISKAHFDNLIDKTNLFGYPWLRFQSANVNLQHNYDDHKVKKYDIWINALDNTCTSYLD